MNDTTDWFTVSEIRDGIYQITEGDPVLPCNTFLLDGGKESLLIDTGLGIGDLRAVVEDLVDGDIRVFLTHSHWDHIGAAHQFDNLAINPRERAPDGSVSIDVLEDNYDQRPGEFMAEWLQTGEPLPDGFDPDGYGIQPVEGVGAAKPGDELRVGDRRLELVGIPGHTPGQTAVLDREAKVCFAADVLEPGYEVYAHFEDSDLDDYRETIDRLIDLRDDGAFDALTIGHGDPIRGQNLVVLDDVEDVLTAVTDGSAPYDVVDTSWGATREHKVGRIVVLTPHE